MIEVDGTFDIECAEWDQFAVGATYTRGQAVVHYDAGEMVGYMRALGGTWWGHAAGIYDSLWFAEQLRADGVSYSGDEAQHRVTRIVCGKLVLRDSYALWPAPLDDLCAAVGIDVPSLPWGCVCDLDCGGYCQIGPRAAEGDPDLEAYVIGDCASLYQALAWLRKTAQAHGIDLRGTLGTTAWKAAQGELGLPDANYPSWSAWRRMRACDKPGRLEVFRAKAHGHGYHSDMRSAYPSALAAVDLPVGDPCELGARHAQLALGDCRPGLYHVTVRIPDDLFLPPLPWRIGDRVCYPVGTITGWWALPELVAAFERGVTVVDVRGAICWDGELPVFREIVQRWHTARTEAGHDSPLGKWFAALPRALCGKFAESPEKRRILANPDRIRICTREGGCRVKCTGRCRRYKQLDLMGHMWSAPYWSLPPSAHVQWSAYLRAATRIKWLTEAEKFGRDLVYGNTDSLWTSGNRLPDPIGDSLGSWHVVNDWASWECRGPNCYRAVTGDGTVIVRGAGTSRGISDTDWQRGGGVIDRGVMPFGQAVRSRDGGLFRRRHRKWTLPPHPTSGLYGDRRMGSDGVTLPLDAREWREIAKRRIPS